MQVEKSENRGELLGPMWKTHREYLRRLLIGLTRDIDLADDLLQESYLRALAGIDGYRGGDKRAWLTAIVKNSFYSHMRRRYVLSEIPLGEEDRESSGAMMDHLDLIEVRRAVSDLPEIQRRALLMKHYGGYNYEDIAAHMGCPIGTAKSRVGLALRKLRETLAVPREEIAVVKCADLAERTLMDFVYGRMPESERKRVEEHLAGCSSCRERAGEVGLVLRALDAVEADYRGTFIHELHDDGTASSYMFVTDRKQPEQPVDEMVIGCGPINFAFVNGEEARIEEIGTVPVFDQGREYRLHLAQPVAPGEPIELLMISLPMEGGVTDMGGGLREFGPSKLVFSKETVYVMAIRLPTGAAFECATPEPQEVRTNGATTVVWRDVLEPGVERNFGVGYRL